jgi:hypothetical protein
MSIVKKNKVYDNNMTKREAFNTISGDLMSIGLTSPSFHNTPPPKSNRSSRINSYYGEMKPLFLILKVFGLLPYDITSNGKSNFLNRIVSYSFIKVI